MRTRRLAAGMVAGALALVGAPLALAPNAIAATTTITVPGDTGTPTSAGVVAGEVTLTATGTTVWCLEPAFNCLADADGVGEQSPNWGSFFFGGSFFGVVAPFNTLLARIGDGDWTIVGSGPTTLTGTGLLELVVGDTAYDDNAGELSVSVALTVTSAGIVNLIEDYVGPGTSYAAKIVGASDKLARGDVVAGQNQLQSFRNSVKAQIGKSFTTVEAATLITLSTQL